MSLMKMGFRIVHAGSERTVVAGPKQIVAFERHWGLGLGKALTEVRIEHLAWLAHAGCHAEAQAGNGPAVKPFDSWLDDLQDIEALGEEPRPLDGTA